MPNEEKNIGGSLDSMTSRENTQKEHFNLSSVADCLTNNSWHCP